MRFGTASAGCLARIDTGIGTDERDAFQIAARARHFPPRRHQIKDIRDEDYFSFLALAALSTACHKSPSDKLADQNAADARADVLNDYSTTLDAQAKQLEERNIGNAPEA